MSRFLVFVIISLLSSRVLGHGGVWNYSISGEWRPGYRHHHFLREFERHSDSHGCASTNGICPRFFPYYPAEGQSSIQRHWIDFSPIVDTDVPALVCNNPGSYAEEYATVDAGAEIQAYYRGWPHDIGPIIVWMAYCGSEPTSCSSFNGTGRHWFKVSQAGLLSGGIREGLWAQKQMIANNYTWSVTLPERLKGGAYLMRHELIALHVPFTPEFYPQCIHLYIPSSGGEMPGEEYLASIPGVWNKDGEQTF